MAPLGRQSRAGPARGGGDPIRVPDPCATSSGNTSLVFGSASKGVFTAERDPLCGTWGALGGAGGRVHSARLAKQPKPIPKQRQQARLSLRAGAGAAAGTPPVPPPHMLSSLTQEGSLGSVPERVVTIAIER